MRNIKLTIEYDGTNYYGWQKQPNGPTVQQSIEDALRNVTKEDVEVIGSSRTDSGVHALGFVANFKTKSSIPVEKIPLALNCSLPGDIVIKNAQEVSEDFHARFSSTGKKYKYMILNDDIPSALEKNYKYFYPYKLDISAMQKACKYFIGEHDFAAFKSTGDQIKSTVRNIFECNIVKNDRDIELLISGNGFLYNMVRIIVGTLIDVGIGKTRPEDIEKIILSKDRRLAGKTVPPYGLYLVEVYYEN